MTTRLREGLLRGLLAKDVSRLWLLLLLLLTIWVVAERCLLGLESRLLLQEIRLLLLLELIEARWLWPKAISISIWVACLLWLLWLLRVLVVQESCAHRLLDRVSKPVYSTLLLITLIPASGLRLCWGRRIIEQGGCILVFQFPPSELLFFLAKPDSLC